MATNRRVCGWWKRATLKEVGDFVKVCFDSSRLPNRDTEGSFRVRDWVDDYFVISLYTSASSEKGSEECDVSGCIVAINLRL